MILIALALALPFTEARAEEAAAQGFEIKVFEVTGNTIYPEEKLRAAVLLYTGADRTVGDVEKARDALEKLYHDAGYPTVLVNIPEQTLKDGVVKLQIIESRIGRVKITGNRYFTMEKVMQDLPSFEPGKILYLPDVQTEIGRLNRSQDIKVDPVISSGKVPGTVDVELKVEDHLPLHGFLELNNRASHNTSALRLSGTVHYDNLWQSEHSLTAQYQTAPLKPQEVEVAGATYVLPAPWEKDDQWAIYGIWSGSKTTIAEGFSVMGKGEIVGTRYAMALTPYKLYTHTLTLGADYKHFDTAIGFTNASGETTHTPITYLPLSASYSSSLPDERGGMNQFSLALNISLRGVVSKEEEFDQKRFKGTADYQYMTASFQRNQKLPKEMNLILKLDGQKTNQPLIDNEQFSAGGMESVRGYWESEAAGDEAVHAILELAFPSPTTNSRYAMTPYLFYDIADLKVVDAQPGQQTFFTLEGAGLGVRGQLGKDLEYELDAADALRPTDRIRRNAVLGYFKIKTVF
jgi:hemolysin activation/secretion protein